MGAIGTAGPATADEDGRPLATWGFWESMGMFLLGNIVLGAVVAGGLIYTLYGITTVGSEGARTPDVVATIAADIVFVATMVVWLSIRHKRWRETMGLPRRDRFWRDLGFGVLAGIVIYILAAVVIGVILTLFYRVVLGRPVTTPPQLSPHLSAGAKVLAAVLALVVAPITEEFFFRGVLFGGMRDRHGFWPAALVSSLLFGLAHWEGPWQDALLLTSVMCFTGFGLAWVYDRRRSLTAAVATHMTFNVIGVILIFSGIVFR
jgi:hypothetical protein